MSKKQNAKTGAKSVSAAGRKAQAVASQLGLAFPVLLDADKAVSQRFELASMPSTLLIDREGLPVGQRSFCKECWSKYARSQEKG